MASSPKLFIYLGVNYIMKQVRKRDGRIVNFDRQKIIEAVEKAFASVDETVNPYSIEKLIILQTILKSILMMAILLILSTFRT